MAPPRKKKRAPGEGHAVHLRLPADVFEWVEARANEKGWPFNRAIINTLADYPDLLRYRDFANLLEDMRIVLARYGARVTLADLSEPLLRAVDEILAAQSESELRSRLDKLRVLRSAMLKHERDGKGRDEVSP
jgi:hypothetical protein